MTSKDFLSIADMTPSGVAQLVREAEDMKSGYSERPLEGMQVALLFEKPSLRTRVSFEVGVRQLGGECIYLSREDVGLGVREPVVDVARVLDRWVDAIVARVFDHRSLTTLADHTRIPVINALSDREHPCQAVGDMLTIKEARGGLDGLRLAFIGDGNNVAASLAFACASVGMDFVHSSPPSYQLPSSAWELAREKAAPRESMVSWVELPHQAARDADVVYTDVWVSMGQEDHTEERLRDFAGYQVDDELMAHAKPDSLFMHDMPAHEGDEIAAGMLDHPRSVVFDQAENRLHAQKAVLARLLAG